MTDTIQVFGITDVGLKRENNEDAFAAESELGLCVVADGMGGAAAGELASRIFMDTALEIFSKSKNYSDAERTELVQQTFTSANDRILKHVDENPDHKGMGCTAEVLAFTSEGFILGHMGDSRTYRFRDNELKQLSNDHSLVQEQLDQGLISPAEAKNHPMRNIILKAVGVNNSVAPDLLKGTVVNGDLFLLCSDGLTDMVDDTVIVEVFRSIKDLSEMASKFVTLAKSAGGRDNITAVLAKVD